MHVLVEIMECRVRNPRFIEMQRVNVTADRVFDHLHVVKNTVVGTLGNRENAWGGRAIARTQGFACKGICFDFFSNVFGLEFFQGDGANNSQMVARGH